MDIIKPQTPLKVGNHYEFPITETSQIQNSDGMRLGDALFTLEEIEASTDLHNELAGAKALSDLNIARFHKFGDGIVLYEFYNFGIIYVNLSVGCVAWDTVELATLPVYSLYNISSPVAVAQNFSSEITYTSQCRIEVNDNKLYFRQWGGGSHSTIAIAGELIFPIKRT